MKNSRLEKLLDKLLMTPRAKREERIKEMGPKEQKDFYDYFKEQTLTHKHNLYGKSYEEKVQFRVKYISDHPNEMHWDFGDYIAKKIGYISTPFLISTNGDLISYSVPHGLCVTSNNKHVIRHLNDEAIVREYKNKAIYIDRLRVYTFTIVPNHLRYMRITKASQCKAGDKFGNLTLLNTDFKCVKQGDGVALYGQCRCSCGNIADIHLPRALKGSVKSCGCLRLLVGFPIEKHPLYSTWCKMRQRCTNKNDNNYSSYGGRGIKVGKDFVTFGSFLNLMYPTWKPGLSLDRIDVNKGYTASNCQWADHKQQGFNKRTTIRIIDPFKGDILSVTAICKRYGISRATIAKRYKQGKEGVDLLNISTNYYNFDWKFHNDSERAAILEIIRNNSPEEATLMLNMKLIDVLIISYYDSIKKSSDVKQSPTVDLEKCCSAYTQIRKGDKFGNYLIIGDIQERRDIACDDLRRKLYVLCRCICGREKIVNAYRLYSGTRISCGCSTTKYRVDNQQDDAVISQLPLFNIHYNMMSRCYNPDCYEFPLYGSRGIKVSKQLQDPKVFNDLMLPTWKPGLSLDRIDVNKGYTLSNIRWATKEMQCNNQRRIILCKDVLVGDEISLSQLARRYNINNGTLVGRCKRGHQGIDLILRKKGFYLTKWPILSSDEQSVIINTLSRLPIEEAIKELDIELADASVIKHLHCNK